MQTAMRSNTAFLIEDICTNAADVKTADHISDRDPEPAQGDGDPERPIARPPRIDVIAGFGIFFKPVHRALQKLWCSLNSSFKADLKQRRVVLRFVAMDFPDSFWGISHQGDRPILVILTRWYVTHEAGSGSGLPVRLLKVHLLSPFAEDLIDSELTIASPIGESTRWEPAIPEGETRNVTIHCNLSIVVNTEKRLKVRLAVEDQLDNKYILPQIKVSPVLGDAPSSN
jgi:hypothetical protein